MKAIILILIFSLNSLSMAQEISFNSDSCKTNKMFFVRFEDDSLSLRYEKTVQKYLKGDSIALFLNSGFKNESGAVFDFNNNKLHEFTGVSTHYGSFNHTYLPARGFFFKKR